MCKIYFFFKYYLIFIIINLLNISLINASISFSYPKAVTLKNGNIFVIHKYGVSICDSSCSEIIADVITFSTNEQITNENYLSKVTIAQFDDGFIITAILYKLYIFNINGEFEFSKYLFDSIPSDIYYNIAPHKNMSSYYYYYYSLGFVYQNLLYIYYYMFDAFYNENYLIDGKTEMNDYYYHNIQNKGLSCQFMKYQSNDVLTCAYYATTDFKKYISFALFLIYSNSINLDYSIFHYYYWEDIKCIKSTISNDKSKALFCLYKSTGEDQCLMFNIYNNTLIYYYTHTVKCINNYYGLDVYYFLETDEYVFSCITTEGSIQFIFYDQNFNELEKTKYKFTECESIYGYSLLYSDINNDYYILSDAQCNGVICPYEILFDIEEKEEEMEEEEEEEKEKGEEEKEKEEEEKEEEKKEEMIEEEIEEKKKDEAEEILEEEMIEEEIKEEKEEEKGKELEEEKGVEEKEIEEKIEEKGVEEEEEKEEENEEEVKEKEKEEIEEKKNEEKNKEKEQNLCDELEKCELCNEESISKDLCIKCNNKKGYYFLNENAVSLESINNQYIECINMIEKPLNFYFNKENKDFRPCYELCATCDYGGDGNENNCTSCESNYILKPDYTDSTNCIRKCQYFYYYTNFGQYKCTNTPICPDEYNLLIKEKGKCIDNCENDNIYKYTYNGECLKECPIDTIHDENEFLCKDIDSNKCLLSESKFTSLSDNLDDNEIERIAQNFAHEFQYTDNHVSIFKNDIYSITLYKNGECISKLSLLIPEIDFGECYSKIKNNYHIDDNLVIAIISKKIDGRNYSKMMSYSMYEPINGNKLTSEDICKDDTLIVQENLISKIDNSTDINALLYLTDQNIDIFNLSTAFYTDICYHFITPVEGKDIALKDRILLYYPNVTLCENGCQIKGVNLTTFKAMCECIMNNLLGDIIIESNILYQSSLGEIKNMISQTNIEVIKCYKDIFEYKYFISNTGGFIIISLIIIQIILIIIYSHNGLYLIRKYLLDVTEKYISFLYLQKNNTLISNISSTQSLKDNKLMKENELLKKKTEIIRDNNKIKIRQNNRKYKTKIERNRNAHNKLRKKNILNIKNAITKHMCLDNNNINSLNNQNYSTNNHSLLSNTNNSNTISIKNIRKRSKRNINRFNNNLKNSYDNLLISNNGKLNKYNSPNLSSNANTNNNLLTKNLNDVSNININEYLKTEPDNMDYDDAIKKDKRAFFQYFYDKLKKNQIILNTFYIKDPLRPRTLKILLFVLDIDLYLFINGLFFTEDYISQMFRISDDEGFLSFIERFMGRFFYITLVGIIVNYIIECFFIDEIKIKGILRREKESFVILKYEMSQIIKNISKRNNLFILFSLVISIFILYYVFCFNNIYPSMKGEWIKSSIIIIFTMQGLSILQCLLETIIRFISFKCKSEKIYKISFWLS